MNNGIGLITNKIEELYYVLKRDTLFTTKVLLDHKIICDEENMETFVKCVEVNYPEEFEKAETIVNDPNREKIFMWSDEVKHFANKYEQLEFDRNNMQDLIHAFLEDNEDVRPRFIGFLKEKKQEQDEGDVYWIDDIDWHIINFSAPNE
ncbi:hypothetical protein [Schinkia azotoformans]|uniref:hypothetical protein n=1 Tax=Schinkia azotoformans TaxID=1454 RepID=UPI002DBE26B2|nr:hypothetical protein [Schinkia azotoformans]MEC1780050.1 hypothetical protein [Schinkia azotoformans]MED4330871.1 hypothetical protein [Schinkia azotoformans]